MASESGTGYRVIDRRAAVDDEAERRGPPAGYRLHSLLLGHGTEAWARDFLRTKGIHPEHIEELMVRAENAHKRVVSLPPLADNAEIRPLDDADASTEIDRVLSRPEWRSAFAPGSWRQGLVEIAKLVPLQASLDIAYAEGLAPRLDRKKLVSAVQLCFPEKQSPDFHVSAEQGQKSVSISTIHPSLEVLGLRCGQQGENGPLVVSFMVAEPPPVLTVLRHAGRCFLPGGYHRVHRLMQAGFSHAPCLLREVADLSDLTSSRERSFPEAVLVAPRPPLFADFADPELAVLAPLRAMRRVIRIRPDEYLVPS